MSPRSHLRAQLITSASLIALGLIWMGQGMGLLRGSSFMVDDRFWAALGAVFVVAGAILALMAWRSRPAG